MRYDESLRHQASTAHDDLGSVMIALGDADAAIQEYRLAAGSDPKSRHFAGRNEA